MSGVASGIDDWNANESLNLVDDIFRKLPISNIRKLKHEYRSKVSLSQENLHHLVGLKYRDLIKIAEEIDGMYQTNQSLHGKLSELSYERTDFVKFDKLDGYSKFNETVRSHNAAEVKNKEKITILNNILNGCLLKFDLKLSSDLESPLKRTSMLVYYAKIYYTTEITFKGLLKSNPATNKKFLSFKNNFLKYLEFEMARYNVSKNATYSNNSDYFRTSQRLLSKDIISDSDIIESDWNYDLAEEEGNDYMDEDTDEELGTDDDYSKDHISIFNKNKLPIVNYLTAYIILNRNNEEMNNINKVSDQFIRLRLNYLKAILSKFFSLKSINLDFFKVFRFVENTCDYVTSYFQNESSELINNLISLTEASKSSEIIGFEEWLGEDIIIFDQEPYSYKIVKQFGSSRQELEGFLDLLFNSFQYLISIGTGSLHDISKAYVVLHNVIVCLNRLSHVCQANDSTLHLISLLNEREFLNKILFEVVNETKRICESHFDHISDPNGLIISKVHEAVPLNVKEINSMGYKLFSNNMIEMIDRNLDQYLKMVTSSSNSVSGDPLCKAIDIWFNDYVEFCHIINFNAQSRSITSTNCLGNLLKHSSSKDSSLETFQLQGFSRDSILDEFSKLSVILNEKFWVSLLRFIKETKESFQSTEEESITTLCYSLNVATLLKEKVLSMNHNTFSSNTEESLKLLDTFITDIFNQIFTIAPNSSFSGAFESFVQRLFGDNSFSVEDFSMRPSLELTSILFDLTKEFFDTESPKLYFENLYTNKSINSAFIEIKNKWIIDNLVQRILEKFKTITNSSELKSGDTQVFSDEVENETGSIVDNSKLESKTLKLIFTNFIFLLHFVSSEMPDINNIYVSELKDCINSYLESTLEESTVREVLKGVSEHYNSTRDMYLPLLVN
ncbi:uncharacterized protein PRCAT00001510001 [Priceomyces carsonii]|uniref:uncharacterized protein n=1 Tax=Priceomyces carsonii TaxID=28549 RepID=UPI002EDA743A|nr:unnamed protein product [Priceomyces carsonii]